MSDVSRKTRSLTASDVPGSLVQVPGRRRYVRHGGALCSRCLELPPAGRDSYCAACRAEINKAWRKRQRIAKAETPPIGGINSKAKTTNKQRADQHGNQESTTTE